MEDFRIKITSDDSSLDNTSKKIRDIGKANDETTAKFEKNAKIESEIHAKRKQELAHEIENLEALKRAKDRAFTAENIQEFEKAIKESQGRINALNSDLNKSSGAMSAVTEGAKKFSDSVSTAYGWIRKAAYVIPGLGIGGLIMLGWEALSGVVKEIVGGLDEATKAKDRLLQVESDKKYYEKLLSLIDEQTEAELNLSVQQKKISQESADRMKDDMKRIKDEKDIEMTMIELRKNAALRLGVSLDDLKKKKDERPEPGMVLTTIEKGKIEERTNVILGENTKLNKEIDQLNEQERLMRERLTRTHEAKLTFISGTAQDKRNKDAKKSDKDRLKDIDAFFNAEVNKTFKQMDVEQDFRMYKAQKEKTQLEKESKMRRDILEGEWEWQQLLNKEVEDEAEKRKKAEEKRLKEEANSLKQSALLMLKYYESISQMQLDSIDHQEEVNRSSIDMQKTAAKEGLKNELAFQEKRQNDLEKQRLAEVKRLKKEKELEVFLNSVAQFSQTDPKTAVVKALGVLATAKIAEVAFMEKGGIAGDIGQRKIIGGSASNGILFGNSHSSGGILTELEHGEGVLSKNEMASLGRQGFYNLKTMLQKPMIEKPVGNPVFIGMENVVSELRELQTIVKRKSEVSVDWDNMGNMIVTSVENGIKTATKNMTRKPRI